ncbi:hypothetical protein [Cyanobacterium sp. Dongsha4]|uniref:hypothetical protein n=1 Tax=Cyanobacterium sp. DS4 TaxID=2878255 RepID=UPI002E7FB9E3|nr:hypothetical protein [Cyanobacterium sp. Dongsha4]WVL00400.1 hypothetical protein Dongsha4_17410 [Cyanobacterium sp. Dongsha4]
MDKLITQIASLGVPGLILLFLMFFSGYAGAAAITTALATLGGPMGMLGGIGVLLLLTKISEGIAEYGFENIAKGVVREMRDKGKTKLEIVIEIEQFPLISAELKQKLIKFVKEYF